MGTVVKSAPVAGGDAVWCCGGSSARTGKLGAKKPSTAKTAKVRRWHIRERPANASRTCNDSCLQFRAGIYPLDQVQNSEGRTRAWQISLLVRRPDWALNHAVY